MVTTSRGYCSFNCRPYHVVRIDNVAVLQFPTEPVALVAANQLRESADRRSTLAAIREQYADLRW